MFANKRVAMDIVGRRRVSTVYLADVEYYETVVFGPSGSGRYDTYESAPEAHAGHKRAVTSLTVTNRLGY